MTNAPRPPADVAYPIIPERMPEPDLLLSRVLGTEADIRAIRNLIVEIRSSDARIVEQRSDSLAAELSTTAEHIVTLGKEERAADRREYMALVEGLEQRRVAAHGTLDQRVRDWRASDREAAQLQADEIERRLQALNGEHQRTAHVLNSSVTREVFQSEKEALQSAINALDRSLLGMSPQKVADNTHAEMRQAFDRLVSAAAATLDTKINVAQQQIAELKEYVDKTQGRNAGLSTLYGMGIAAVGLIISVIIVVNALMGP